MGIYFVRHGQTDWNLHGKMQGKTDIPLNDFGREQAQQTRDKLKDIHMDRVFCSPLKRAKETAQIINENWNLPIVEDCRIQERDFGVYEGQLCKQLDYQDLWKISNKPPFNDAEDSITFYRRVENFLDSIKTIAQDENILLVAHGGVSIPFYCYFHGYDFENLHTVMLANCEVSYMEAQKSEFVQRG